MDIENTKETQEETFGKILHDERLKKGKTLRDVANELCIRRVYLEAIEKMEFDRLPPAPYGSGFVRNYAQYLGLNAERMVVVYKQLTNPASAEKKHNPERHDDPTGSPKVWHILLGMIGLALLIFVWRYWNTENITMAAEEDFSPANSSVVAEPEILNSSEKNEDENVAEETGDAQDAQNVEEEKDQQESVVETNHLKFVLKGPSWLELKKDDAVLLSGNYQKGFTYDVPAGENVVISVGRHYNIQFYLNDQPIKVVSAMKKINVSLGDFFKKDN